MKILIVEDEKEMLQIMQHSLEKEAGLPRKEYDILPYLVTNRNRPVRKSALPGHILGDHVDQADSVEFICFQNKKLRKNLNLPMSTAWR